MPWHNNMLPFRVYNYFRKQKASSPPQTSIGVRHVKGQHFVVVLYIIEYRVCYGNDDD